MTLHDHEPPRSLAFSKAQQAFIGRAVATGCLAVGQKVHDEIAEQHAEQFAKLEQQLWQRLEARVVELLDERFGPV